MVQNADVAGLRRLVNGLMTRIKTTHEAKLYWCFDSANGDGATVHPSQAEVDRLFAENGLSGRDRLFQEICVRIGRRRDEDGVYIGRGKHFGGSIHHACARGSRDSFGRRAVDVLHSRQAGARMRGNIGGMHGADAPAAEHSDSDH